MRTTRVKSHAITGDAMASLAWVKTWGINIGIGLLCMIPLLPLYLWKTHKPSKEELALEQERAQVELQRKVAASTSLADAQQCTGRVKSYTFGKDPIKVNPDGQCKVLFQWPDSTVACLLKKSEGSDKVYGPYGNCPNRTTEPEPLDVEYAWSAGEPFKGRVVLYPRENVQLVRWK